MTEPIIIKADTVADDLGIVPKKDPKTGRIFYLWDDMFPRDPKNDLPIPRFGAQETAKAFFGKGADWLRWRYHPQKDHPNGYFVLDGVVLEPKRTKSGQRCYSLADIERMAHALAGNQAISGAQVEVIIAIALHVGRLYRVL